MTWRPAPPVPYSGMEFPVQALAVPLVEDLELLPAVPE